MSLLQRETRALDPNNGSSSKPASCLALKVVIHTSLIFFFFFPHHNPANQVLFSPFCKLINNK